MGIKIHHGPDGTFKTSGAIKDDIIPLIKSGRTLVTNVRGFSKENAIKVLGRKKVHKDFKVIFVDTEVQAGRDKMARFFHWAPHGAFFVIDEVQRIFKPKWREADIKKLDYPGGAEQAKIDDRPEDMDVAWDMQRHYNWDFVFTTTTITKVRPEMKDMAKVAIRHYNLGIWRFYKTVEHATDSRGTSKSSQGTVKLFNYVPSQIFKLYSSTKTGAFTNSEPRTPFYRDPKILGMLVFLFFFWTYLLSKPVPKAIGGADDKNNVEVKEVVSKVVTSSNQVSSKGSHSSIGADANNASVNKFHSQDVSLDLMGMQDIAITGSVENGRNSEYAFIASYNGERINISSFELEEFGYTVEFKKPCRALIKRFKKVLDVYCSPNIFKNHSVDVSQARSNGTAAALTST